MASRIKWSVALTALLAVFLLANTALAAIRYSAQRAVAPPNSWNYGNSLGASTCGGNEYLNSTYATDYVNGEYATDDGPYQGVYVQRANRSTDPLNWSSPKRVSPTSQHAERPTLASAGSSVYAGSVTQTSYDNYRPGAPRVFYVSRSTDCGATWRAPSAITGLRGRVDYPILAAAGSRVYAIYTDADTGEIKLRRSTDRGATWLPARVVGTTTSNQDDGDGYYAYPTIGASGSNVLIGWYTNDAGRTVARLSSDGGATFEAPVELTARSPNDTIHYAIAAGQDDGVDDRVAIAYTTGSYTAGRVAVRVSSNGSSFGAAQEVLTYGDSVGGNRIGGSYGPAPQPFGSNGILVVFPGCRIVDGLANPCNYNRNTMRSDLLLWQQVGTTVTGPQVVQAAVSGQTINDSASLVVRGNTRYILYNGWTSNYSLYRTFLRVASGS
jgi:hypothetical protein